MILAILNYKGNKKIYLDLLKRRIEEIYKIYKPVLSNIISSYNEKQIYAAIDSIYLSGNSIYCPTNGQYGQILRALEYGTGKNKSYHIISQATRNLFKEVKGYEFVI